MCKTKLAFTQFLTTRKHGNDWLLIIWLIIDWCNDVMSISVCKWETGHDSGYLTIASVHLLLGLVGFVLVRMLILTIVITSSFSSGCTPVTDCTRWLSGWDVTQSLQPSIILRTSLKHFSSFQLVERYITSTCWVCGSESLVDLCRFSDDHESFVLTSAK